MIHPLKDGWGIKPEGVRCPFEQGCDLNPGTTNAWDKVDQLVKMKIHRVLTDHLQMTTANRAV